MNAPSLLIVYTFCCKSCLNALYVFSSYSDLKVNTSAIKTADNSQQRQLKLPLLWCYMKCLADRFQMKYHKEKQKEKSHRTFKITVVVRF